MILSISQRLHYDPHELTIFEKVESEWPLFFTYLILDGIFFNKPDQVAEYRSKLEPLLVDSSQFLKYNRDHQRSDTGSEYSYSRPMSAASDHSGVASVAVSPKSISRKLSFAKKRLPPANMRLVPELYIVPR